MSSQEVVKFSMSQPADWLEAFKAQAEKENMSLSEWIGECCRANVFVPLPDRRPVGRPKED